MSNSWQDLVSGENCPFDKPRLNVEEHMLLIRELSISTLFLDRNQAYRGHCVLVFDPRHVVRIDQLTPSEWTSFAEDLRVSESALFAVFKPDHMNVESLGNMVPHLHWHIIPRYMDDPRWGGPIWTTAQAELAQAGLAGDEYRELVEKIKSAIDKLDVPQ